MEPNPIDVLAKLMAQNAIPVNTEAIARWKAIPEEEQAETEWEDALDDAEWDALVARYQPQLIAAARRAKAEIAAGLAVPLNLDDL